MSIKRYIGDNGELLRYEMNTRGKRVYFKETIKDIAIRFAIVFVGFSFLAAVFLITN